MDDIEQLKKTLDEMKIEYFDLSLRHGSTADLKLPQTAVVMQPTKTLTGTPQLAVLIPSGEVPMSTRTFLTMREWVEADVPDAGVVYLGCVKSKVGSGSFYIFEVKA